MCLLEKSGYKIHVRTGIYRDNPLKIEEYANLLQRSRIALNFTMLPQYNTHQSKTRTAEILHCGALLLESINEHTPKRFDSSDYIGFSDIDDLKQKIDYYLEHEDERLIIAKQGHDKVHQKYNEILFWKAVQKRLYLI
jgi:spore maturation protein CgeB